MEKKLKALDIEKNNERERIKTEMQTIVQEWESYRVKQAKETDENY